MSRFTIATLSTVLLAAAPAFADHDVNVNTASLEALDTLPGVGPSIAQNIIDARPYASTEEIHRAKGIGEPGSKTYDDIIGHIVISGGATASSPAPAPSPSPSPSGSPSTVSSYVTPPEAFLFADAGRDRTVVVGADTEFRARAYDRGGERAEYVRFSWNFGDGVTAEGQTVLHHFSYPGRYAVVLTIAEHQDAASDVVIVTAVPADLALTLLSGGGIAIENRSASDLDLSRWIVETTERQFVLPENSFVLAGQAIRISADTLGTPADSATTLLYPNGSRALGVGETVQETEAGGSAAVPAPPASPPPSATPRAIQAAEPAPTSVTSEEPVEEEDTPTARAAAAAAADLSLSDTEEGAWKWWTGAFAFALAGAATVYVMRRLARREWTLIDDAVE